MYTYTSHIRLHGVERDNFTSTSIINNNATQYRHGRGGAGTNYRGPAFRKGPNIYVTYAFVFLGRIIICRLQTLTLSDQAHVTLQLKVSVSDLVQRLLAGPFVRGRGRPFFFRRGSSPLSAALIPFNHAVHCQL